MKVAFGKKKQMGRQFQPDGTMLPYTTVQLMPAQVVQVKTKDKDGYSSVKLAVGDRTKYGKSVAGQIKATGRTKADLICEIRTNEGTNPDLGSSLDIGMLKPGATVHVSGYSKGRGFQGVVKRHHFRGHPSTHGHKDQLRMPGSIGAGGVQKVFKGLRMAGHMGTQRVTVKNLEILSVDPENMTVNIKGAVPGAFNGLIFIDMPEVKELVFASNTKQVVEPVKEEAVVENANQEAPVAEDVAVVEETAVAQETVAEENNNSNA